MTTEHPTFPIPAAFPIELTAPGVGDGRPIDGGPLAELLEGSMRRISDPQPFPQRSSPPALTVPPLSAP